MKLKSTHVLAGICTAAVIMMQPAVSLANDGRKEDPNEKERKEVKKETKVSTSRNNNSVRIYPDIVKRVMHVVAKDDNEGQPIDFFVFSLEGTLLHHYKMKAGDHQKLSNLERGKYVFRVFSGDEETASGNFEMR
ncbi:MAG: hypothetical protein JNK14_02495 [Chitinophagaceae bacterium]|nr:hypothetical protein [Chitinophagaceae bacterium]